MYSAAPGSRSTGDRSSEAVEWLSGSSCPAPMDEEVAERVVQILGKTPGLSVSIPTLQSLGSEGLSALAHSVKHELDQERARRQGRQRVSLNILVPHERHKFTVTAFEGDTLFHIAQQDEELARYLECACGGIAACSTCHLIVDEESFKMLEPASSAEEDMLDLAYGLQSTSRLGCQLTIPASADGLTLTIPDGVNNVFN